MSTHHNNTNNTKETPPKTRTRSRKKKTVPPPAVHVNGDKPITVTCPRAVLIDLVGQRAEAEGYLFVAHGDPDVAACVHEAEAFDLVPLTPEGTGDRYGAWFWNVTLEEALVIVGHLDHEKPEPVDDEVDPVALGV
jgi:hypothetical protein